MFSLFPSNWILSHADLKQQSIIMAAEVSYDGNPDRKRNLQLHLEANLHTTKNKRVQLLKSMNIFSEWGSNFPVTAKRAF